MSSLAPVQRLRENEVSNDPPRVDVVSLVRGSLARSPYPSIRQLSCVFGEGRLFLRGRLGSYYHKQLAQEAVANVEGVRQVVNEVEVIEAKSCRTLPALQPHTVEDRDENQ